MQPEVAYIPSLHIPLSRTRSKCEGGCGPGLVLGFYYFRRREEWIQEHLGFCAALVNIVTKNVYACYNKNV